MILTEFENLSRDDLNHWWALFHQSGKSIQHSPGYARALADAGEQPVIGIAENLVAIATPSHRQATLVSGDVPLLKSGTLRPAEVAAAVAMIHHQIGQDIYVPLVDARFRAAIDHQPLAAWDRSPNSSIDWSFRGQDLEQRVLSRGGSQIARKRRKVARDGISVDMAQSGVTAVEDMLAVDDRSWKASAGQSMNQRGNQAALYSSLLLHGDVHATFLRDEGIAVAFRLDALVGGRLTYLKWSFDQAYARYSPGVHLLTTALVHQWSGRDVNVVDLCGGPDHLKELVYSHRHPRVDLWCGDSQAGRELRLERQGLDGRLQDALIQGRGLRHVFS
jgi:CelD/BcsL family acetyltransferase involved in cellulose biosynthesis